MALESEDPVAKDDVNAIPNTPPTVSAMAWGAQKLAECFARKTPRWSQFQDVSRHVAMQRVHGAAAAALQCQESSVNKVLELFSDMRAAGHWEGILWMEQVIYDETPLVVRVGFGDQEKDKQLVKLFVLERKWSMLIRKAATELNQQKGDKHRLCLLEGSYSPGVRGAANATGDTVARVLSTFPAPDLRATEDFKVRVRVAETDDAGANRRCEALLIFRNAAP